MSEAATQYPPPDPLYAPETTGRIIPYTIGERDVMQNLCRAVAEYARTNNEKTDAIMKRTEVIEKQVEALQKDFQKQDRKMVELAAYGAATSVIMGVLWVIWQAVMSVIGIVRHAK